MEDKDISKKVQEFKDQNPPSISITVGVSEDYGVVSAKVQVTDFKAPDENFGDLYRRVNSNALSALGSSYKGLKNALGS